MDKPKLYAYVNPNKADDSVLDKGISKQTLLNYILCIIISMVVNIGIYIGI